MLRRVRRGRPGAGAGLDAREVCVDGRMFDLSTRIVDPEPREFALVVVSHAPNAAAARVLAACIDSLRANTPEEHALWVVDNGSPPSVGAYLATQDVNTVLLGADPASNTRPCGSGSVTHVSAEHAASYANGVSIEIARALMPDGVRYLFTAHQDVAACKRGWLSFLRSKLDDEVKAAGVRLDRARVPDGVLHVLGLLVDVQALGRLELDFLPRLPQYDAGDGVSTGLRAAGFGLYAARNTHTDPALADALPPGSPYRGLAVDRALDDDGDVFFVHLGRGTEKALGLYARPGRATVAEYLRFLDEHVTVRS